MLAALIGVGGLAVGAASPAHAGNNDVIAVVIDGTGNGHGRGMSQWGAYGWAVDQGWDWTTILDHYYGGTVMGDVDPNSRIKVKLSALDGAPVAALVSYGSGVVWNGQTYASISAWNNGSGGFEVWGTPMGTQATCNPQTRLGTVSGTLSFTTAGGEDPAAGAASVLGVCQPSGSVVHYRGTIEVSNQAGSLRVVNNVRAEDYLRGVVPRESPASWGDAGGGRGANALRAQAVAARSYALTQNRYPPYAQTCDTTSCQVYGGAATRAIVSAAATVLEDPRSDNAVAVTVGKVRQWPATDPRAGQLVSTEFSSSNGPRTAGGAFPPVDDVLGDGTAANPWHHWTRIIDASAFADIGTITSATMVEAASSTYQQYDGIWYNDLLLTGTKGSKRINAADLRTQFGLPSPGFADVRLVARGALNASMALIGDSVGNSIAGSASSVFRTVTDGTFTSQTIDTVDGRCTTKAVCPGTSGVEVANSLPLNLDLVVVELGYNDWPPDFAKDIDAMMAALTARGAKRVMWVNMADIRTGTGGVSTYGPANAALSQARSRWPNLAVADWNQASNVPDRSRWFSDGVHLTTTGQANFALWLRMVASGPDGAGGFGPLSRRFAPGQRIELQVVGNTVTQSDGSAATVPAGASAVALNITAVVPNASGYMTVWPCDVARPEASNLNFVNGSVVANGVVAPVGASGKVCIYSNVASDLLVDISGWFAGSAFVGTTPNRFVDTRNGIGAPKARVNAGGVLRVPVAGAAVQRTDATPDAIPVDATAIAMNVTAVTPSAQGYLTVWPCGTPQPVASNVNFLAGSVVANGVVTPVGADGAVCIYSNQNTDILVDVLGWFGSGGGNVPFVGAVPKRLVDTRNAIGGPTARVVPAAPRSVPVRGAVLDVKGVDTPIPADATAVALNVTIADASAAGYATVWPCGTTRPEASNVNFLRGGAVANGVVAPIGADGSVCVYTSTDADLIVDVSGWFTGGNPASFVGNVPNRLVDTRNSIGPAPF
jgi:SpoIID/LytB domain protein